MDETNTHAQTIPVWYAQSSGSERNRHNGHDHWPSEAVDVVIVGAGMAGLSTAYHLLQRGRSVVVLDKGEIAGGETGRSTAHLASALDDRFYRLESLHGRTAAQLAAASHAAAISTIESIVAREGIACEFARVPGYLFAHDDAGRGGRRELLRELRAAERAGLPVQLIERAPVAEVQGLCLRFEAQAQLQPLAYAIGLAGAIERAGGRIFTAARVSRLDTHSGAHRVHLEDGRCVRARAVVVATNSPISDRFALHTKQAAYRSYVIGMRIAPGSQAQALYWDTGEPYHYVRLVRDDLLIIGGEDHKVGQGDAAWNRWARLEAWARRHFSTLGDVSHRWSGQVLEPVDGLAFIGKDPGAERVYIATGDSGNGMTHGAIAGLLLSDLICGTRNPWAELYNPARKPKRLGAVGTFVRENANVALHAAAWLLPKHRRRALERGQGKVVSGAAGLRPVARYVDEAGHVHECSAVCPHLGCLVAWNSAERSWDCPCHGSRFDAFGKVLCGPALRDLAPVEASAAASNRESRGVSYKPQKY